MYHVNIHGSMRFSIDLHLELGPLWAGFGGLVGGGVIQLCLGAWRVDLAHRMAVDGCCVVGGALGILIAWVSMDHDTHHGSSRLHAIFDARQVVSPFLLPSIFMASSGAFAMVLGAVTEIIGRLAKAGLLGWAVAGVFTVILLWRYCNRRGCADPQPDQAVQLLVPGSETSQLTAKKHVQYRPTSAGSSEFSE